MCGNSETGREQTIRRVHGTLRHAYLSEEIINFTCFDPRVDLVVYVFNEGGIRNLKISAYELKPLQKFFGREHFVLTVTLFHEHGLLVVWVYMVFFAFFGKKSRLKITYLELI